jgi:uncharacterized membrane protein YgcG
MSAASLAAVADFISGRFPLKAVKAAQRQEHLLAVVVRHTATGQSLWLRQVKGRGLAVWNAVAAVAPAVAAGDGASSDVEVVDSSSDDDDSDAPGGGGDAGGGGGSRKAVGAKRKRPAASAGAGKPSLLLDGQWQPLLFPFQPVSESLRVLPPAVTASVRAAARSVLGARLSEDGVAAAPVRVVGHAKHIFSHVVHHLTVACMSIDSPPPHAPAEVAAGAASAAQTPATWLCGDAPAAGATACWATAAALASMGLSSWAAKIAAAAGMHTPGGDSDGEDSGGGGGGGVGGGGGGGKRRPVSQRSGSGGKAGKKRA